MLFPWHLCPEAVPWLLTLWLRCPPFLGIPLHLWLLLLPEYPQHLLVEELPPYPAILFRPHPSTLLPANCPAQFPWHLVVELPQLKPIPLGQFPEVRHHRPLILPPAELRTRWFLLLRLATPRLWKLIPSHRPPEHQPLLLMQVGMLFCQPILLVRPSPRVGLEAYCWVSPYRSKFCE